MTAHPTYTPFAAPRRRHPPRLELLERCWRLRSQLTGRDLVCAIFETAAGLEVRAGYRDDLLHSQRCPDLLTARAVAEQFRRVLVEELGSVDEVPLHENGEVE
jgi:hypothetical protein